MSKTLSNRALKRQQNKAKQQQQHHPETSPNEESWTSGVVGIIGGGISGLALALALQRKGIRSIVFEKDQSFEERAQGYGLTIQQAGRAMKALGLTDIVLKAGVASSSHFIFDNSGNVILFWGTTAASGADTWDPSRNCHVSRQALRKSLLDALDEGFTRVIWGFDLENVDQASDKVVVSGFVKASSERVNLEFDLLAACDGIRSMVRKEVLQLNTPSDNGLRFLQSFVMLGIFNSGSFPILHNRMIQMSDGNARMFIMPFDEGRSMWQLSFRMSQETSAIALSKSGTTRLKEEAMRQCATFSTPILELIECTDVGLITGYPVYDREPLTLPVQYSSKFDRVTLLGDAAHPMSPFKGQGNIGERSLTSLTTYPGANQALIDAVDLADCLSTSSLNGVSSALRLFESKMIPRTTPKVLASRESIDLLHCEKFKDVFYQLERRGFRQQEEFAGLMDALRAENVGIWSSSQTLDAACERYGLIHQQ